MAANVNTALGIGITRSFLTYGYRDFEPSGLVQYKCNLQGLIINGTAFNVGDLIPFDVASTSYSLATLQTLRLCWDQTWFSPTQ